MPHLQGENSAEAGQQIRSSTYNTSAQYENLKHPELLEGKASQNQDALP